MCGGTEGVGGKDGAAGAAGSVADQFEELMKLIKEATSGKDMNGDGKIATQADVKAKTEALTPDQQSQMTKMLGEQIAGGMLLSSMSSGFDNGASLFSAE